MMMNEQMHFYFEMASKRRDLLWLAFIAQTVICMELLTLDREILMNIYYNIGRSAK